MTYEQFKIAVIEGLQQDIPDPKTISIEPVAKNNGILYDGLVIMEGDHAITPAIYLNPYYESYLQGSAFQTLYRKILNAYEDNKPKSPLDISSFLNFECIRDNILFKLVNFRKNRKLLEDVPYVPFLDLAIVFYYLVDFKGLYENGSILIHHSHLKRWDLSETELFAIAKENTPLLMQQSFRSIQDVLKHAPSDLQIAECGSEGDAAEESEKDIPMFVLTNQKNMFGAACILYKNLLRKYAAKLKSDFFILPSSIHEVILVPAKDRTSYGFMSTMVREVNATSLLPEEILSDHAYYYNLRTNEISMEPEKESPVLVQENLIARPVSG